MGTFGVLYMDLVHILLTIQSKPYWRVSYKIGAQSSLFLCCQNYNMLTIPFDQGALPHMRTLMETLEGLVLMFTRTCFSVLGQLRCKNFGMAMVL